MAEIITKPSSEAPAGPQALTVEKAIEILWECLWGALFLTILVQICGGITLGLAGGVWHKMTPTLPPELTRHIVLEDNPTAGWDWRFFQHHRFALIYAMLFAGKAVGQLVGYSRNQRHRRVAAWLLRLSRRLSRDWFSLIVGNAFTALVAVFVWQFVQQFSVSGFIGEFIFNLIHPVLDALGSLLLGDGASHTVENLTACYSANQFKFMFWLFYSAAICDDLGLPNYKTLLRWSWRRVRKRLQPAAYAEPTQSPSPEGEGMSRP